MPTTKNQFTPEPLYVSRNPNGSFAIRKDNSSGTLIANLEIQGYKSTDGNPNSGLAYLLASAPALFAALQDIVRIADRNTVEFDAARAALALAQKEAE